MHIAIISVAPPYRGGISKFSSVLVKNKLSTKNVPDAIEWHFAK